jgi:hypothetical protein
MTRVATKAKDNVVQIFEPAKALPVNPQLLSTAVEFLQVSFTPNLKWKTLQQMSEASEFKPLLALHTCIEPGIDIRTQGSLLMNRLGWQLAATFALFDLNAIATDTLIHQLRLHAEIETNEFEGDVSQSVSFQFAMPPPTQNDACLSANQAGKQLEILFTPIVHAVIRDARLSKTAAWSLVTDSIAVAYLLVGRQLQCEARARTRATDILRKYGAPLNNKRWRFQNYGTDESNRDNPSHWYRVRSGCCRYYLLENESYCATCVHVSEDERSIRLTPHSSESP